VKTVAITQRVAVVSDHGERRDCLDQAWSQLLAACGLRPLLLPNSPQLALHLCRDFGALGLILTGGNDLVSCGGDAPERDATEHALLDFTESARLPVLGVCRGMQLLQARAGIALMRVAGHVSPRQTIHIESDGARETVTVNSYHHFGTRESRAPLASWAQADDGVVKAVRHESLPITGIMWHPERFQPFRAADMALLKQCFEVDPCVP
jgi:putative glutamine amidotransferase